MIQVKTKGENMGKRDGRALPAVLRAAVLALGFVAAPAAWSQSQDSKWTFGARAGFAIPAGELNGFTGKAADTGILLNLDLMYKASSTLDIGGSVEYQNNKMPSISGPGTGGGAFGESTITVLTLMAVGQYRFNRSAKTSPYAVAGVGLNINWMGGDQAGNTFDVDPSLALKIGFGADFAISRSTALNLEAGYKLNSSSVTRFPPTGSAQSHDFDMSTFYVLGGVRF
jgi:opacity protein-like surface antigen